MNNNGKSYLSHLLDSATTKNNVPVTNKKVEYKFLYTVLFDGSNQPIPIYCSISNKGTRSNNIIKLIILLR